MQDSCNVITLILDHSEAGILTGMVKRSFRMSDTFWLSLGGLPEPGGNILQWKYVLNR